MSTKASPRLKKHRHSKDTPEKLQEIVQVHHNHKILLSSNNSSDKENTTSLSISTNEDADGEVNRSFQMEDNNENYSVRNATPSREISVDGDSQINSKILSLIETEIKSDAKHTHFTDSRPQSLSFYEDEKVPEELSGNLELLSPEERKHYRKRREHLQQNDERINAYNAIQDLYNNPREAEEIIGAYRKSKSRKKRHGESEIGIGDSREMMIPKEKKRSKKKKRETSPSNVTKRKHKKQRDEIPENKTEIALALDDLQDDVFDNNDVSSTNRRLKMNPCGDYIDGYNDKLYVQRKSKFDITSKSNFGTISNNETCVAGTNEEHKRHHPLQIAIWYQKIFARFGYLCHGFLAGVAFCHWLYLVSNQDQLGTEYLIFYGFLSDSFTSVIYFLLVCCMVTCLDSIDLAHIDIGHIKALFIYRRTTYALILYFVSLSMHLSQYNMENKLVRYGKLKNGTFTERFTSSETKNWNELSLCRFVFCLAAWTLVAFADEQDMLQVHLHNMEKYIQPS